MSNEMGAAVREVAKYFPTAVISGRSSDEVKGFVQLSNVYDAGSHGMDIMVPPKPLKPCDSKNHTTDKKKHIVRGNSQKDRGCKSRTTDSTSLYITGRSGKRY